MKIVLQLSRTAEQNWAQILTSIGADERGRGNNGWASPVGQWVCGMVGDRMTEKILRSGEEKWKAMLNRKLADAEWNLSVEELRIYREGEWGLRVDAVLSPLPYEELTRRVLLPFLKKKGEEEPDGLLYGIQSCLQEDGDAILSGAVGALSYPKKERLVAFLVRYYQKEMVDYLCEYLEGEGVHLFVRQISVGFDR